MLAAARIGAVVIPVSTFATAPEMATQLAHADVEILLAADSYRGNDYRRRLAEIDRTELPLLRHVIEVVLELRVMRKFRVHARLNRVHVGRERRLVNRTRKMLRAKIRQVRPPGSGARTGACPR